MSKLTAYTVELYKKDKRIKKTKLGSRDKVGLRFVSVRDFAPSTKDYIDTIANTDRRAGYVVEVFETYVTRKNALTGQEFQERYDTPYYCSPRSEAYHSM